MARYWVNRSHLDSGLPTAPYWSGVAGRDVSDDEAARLDAVDLGGWARTNAEMLDLIEEQRSAGTRLALLSNAPHVQAEAFERVAWTAGFERIFVSAPLGLVKPDPAIFEHVLQELDASPEDVTFVDDRAGQRGGSRRPRHPGAAVHRHRRPARCPGLSGARTCRRTEVAWRGGRAGRARHRSVGRQPPATKAEGSAQPGAVRTCSWPP